MSYDEEIEEKSFKLSDDGDNDDGLLNDDLDEPLEPIESDDGDELEEKFSDKDSY